MAAVKDLGVLSSAEFIVKNAGDVFIATKHVESAVDFVIDKYHSEVKSGDDFDVLRPASLAGEELLEWIFLIDTINYCFWADEGQELFTVDFKGRRWTGYRSMCAALCRAVENGVPMHKPSFYGKMTLDQLKDVFKSCNDTEIPLIQERLESLHEASTVLNEKFDGKVTELVHQSNKSALRLAQLLMDNFSHYRDVATYKGKEVVILKRAQIFPSDVWNNFKGKSYGEFNDIGSITMFADYRVPQCLMYLKILEYSDALMDTLRKKIHVDKGSNYELEIRGATIWAVELISRGVRDRLIANPSLCPNLSPDGVYPCVIDFFLWDYATRHSKDLAEIPFHRTLTVFY